MVRLHPFGSTLVPVVIVTVLAVVEIVSVTATVLHPLYVPVTVYAPQVLTLILAVVAPLLHVYPLAPLAVSVTDASVHVNELVFGVLVIVTVGVIVYTALVCIDCTLPTLSVER